MSSVLTASVGGVAGLLTLLVTAVATFAAARAASSSADRAFLTTVAVSLLFVRAAGASVLHSFLLHTSPSGAMFFDDSAYTKLADALAHEWRGEIPAPDAQGLLQDSSINSFYITFAGAIYWLTDSNPLALKLVNNALGVGVALLTYRTSRVLGLPGARIAAVALLVFPSLVLWSVLALKDTFVLFIAAAVIWMAAEALQARRFWLWYAAIAIALFPLEGVRRFFFLILVLAWPLGTFIALGPRRRTWLSVASGIVAILVLGATSAWGLYAPGLLSALEPTRGAMALDARSAYVDPAPIVRGSPGDVFTVAVAGQTMAPGQTPRIIYVAPGTNLVVETPGRANASAPPHTGATDAPSVVVRPGDVVVIGTSPSAESSPRPANTGSPTEVRLFPDRANVIATASPAPPNDAVAIGRDVSANLAAFPRGAAYLIAAPFPWLARSFSELATIPEMLLWYLTEALAIVGVVQLVRRRDFRYAYGALVLAGAAFVLILAEGNVGTLLRHRAMIIPEAVALASVGAVVMWRRVMGSP